MNLTELIQKAGPENINVQSLVSSFISMHRKKNDSEITFATDHTMASSVARESQGIPGTHVGLVVWIPRDKINSI